MIFIRNLVLLFITLVMLCACHSKDTSASASNDMPNADTLYITLNTVNMPNDEVLLNGFEKNLQKDHFKFIKNSAGDRASFRNCDTNTIFNIEGSGILNYYAKRTVAEKGSMKNTYADFSLSIFTFENDKVAEENLSIIEEALKTVAYYDYCNGKAPTTFLRIDNTIYYFSTRADMFTTHTVKYANYIKNFHP
jgi:hypothetical protein